MEYVELNTDKENYESSKSNPTNNSRHGLCPDCNENMFLNWCKQCNAKRFQQDFHKWTSGNKFIDKFIQESQLNAERYKHILEWIPNILTKEDLVLFTKL